LRGEVKAESLENYLTHRGCAVVRDVKIHRGVALEFVTLMGGRLESEPDVTAEEIRALHDLAVSTQTAFFDATAPELPGSVQNYWVA
jgi:hypothetical protein